MKQESHHESGGVPRWTPGLRERLVVAAADLFNEQGYDATTVAQIAERAGVTKSTFFRSFADKRDVLVAGQATSVRLLAEGNAEAWNGRRRRWPRDIAIWLHDCAPRSPPTPNCRNATPSSGWVWPRPWRPRSLPGAYRIRSPTWRPRWEHSPSSGLTRHGPRGAPIQTSANWARKARAELRKASTALEITRHFQTGRALLDRVPGDLVAFPAQLLVDPSSFLALVVVVT